MEKSLLTIVDAAAAKQFSAVDQGRLTNGGLLKDVMACMNEPANRGLVSLPGEGAISAEHWELPLVEPENEERVRAVVGEVLQRVRERVLL